MHLWRRVFSRETSITETMDKPKLLHRIDRKTNNKVRLNMPCGIAVTKNGDFVVVDTENNRLVILSKEGNLKRTVAEKGSQPNQLNRPVCVALTRDEDECIAVTDSVNAAIKIFTQNGTFVKKFCEDGIFDYPHGIAVTLDHDFVVTDVCKHCVFVIHPSGSVKKAFGRYGDGSLDFDHPYFVTVNNYNQILVSDHGNTAVKIFDIDGRLLQHFSMFDFKLHNENFLILQDIALDEDGNVLVIGNSTVYILARNGRLWEVIRPEYGLFSPRCLSYVQPNQLVLTQASLDKNFEISVFAYNMDDFKSLKSLPLPPNRLGSMQPEL